MKRTTLFVVLMLSAVTLFAGGAREVTETTGTITSIERSGSSDSVVTVVTPEGEELSMSLSDEVIASLDLIVGSEMTVEGEIDDDEREIEAEWVTADGTEVEVEIVNGEVVSVERESEDDDDEDDEDDDDDGDDD